MFIEQSTMDAIHDVQYDMLKKLISVMNELHIKYYFVHGSLLGAVRDNDIIAEDDDIDIAIFREDYNRLLFYGQELLPPQFFLQNSANDEFPLPFAKMRKSDTAFIQPVLKNIRCNKGLYIDIFPIDYDDCSFSFKFKKALYSTRISQVLHAEQSVKGRLLGCASKVCCVSYYRTLLKREILLSSLPKNNYVSIFGGKLSEIHMPMEWFLEQKEFKFRDITVTCPIGYASYLERTYGKDYMNHNPAISRMKNKKIEISADILDLEKSYLDYLD